MAFRSILKYPPTYKLVGVNQLTIACNGNFNAVQDVQPAFHFYCKESDQAGSGMS